MLIVINDAETTISVAEGRRLCRDLREGAKGAVTPAPTAAAAFVVSEAITRGLRDTRMNRLVIREPGALRAIRLALESRTTALSEAEARLLEATRMPSQRPSAVAPQIVQPEAERSD